jgi:hypothetical protein
MGRSCLVDEQILGLQISMQHAFFVAEGHTTKQLIQERLHAKISGRLEEIGTKCALENSTFMVFLEMMPLC